MECARAWWGLRRVVATHVYVGIGAGLCVAHARSVERRRLRHLASG